MFIKYSVVHGFGQASHGWTWIWFHARSNFHWYFRNTLHEKMTLNSKGTQKYHRPSTAKICDTLCTIYAQLLQAFYAKCYVKKSPFSVEMCRLRVGCKMLVKLTLGGGKVMAAKRLFPPPRNGGRRRKIPACPYGGIRNDQATKPTAPKAWGDPCYSRRWLHLFHALMVHGRNKTTCQQS